MDCCYYRQPISHTSPHLHFSQQRHFSLLVAATVVCGRLLKPLLLAALLVSLLCYIAVFSPDKLPPAPLSPDPLTAAGQWLGGSLLATLLAGGYRALATVCLAFLLCVVHALLRSASFSSRTHARAAIVARRTPVVQLMKRMEQTEERRASLKRPQAADGD